MSSANSVSYGRAMPSWRNDPEVEREPSSPAMRQRTMAGACTAAQASVAPPKDQEIPALSTDGLEVFEITVLDVAPASMPKERS